jgi:hypothetical protein
MATWALFIKVGGRAFILLMKSFLKIQNFEKNRFVEKHLVAQNSIRTLFKKII